MLKYVLAFLTILVCYSSMACEDLDNSKILNNIDYVESPNSSVTKTLGQNSKYTQHISLHGELNLYNTGKYKIQILLGVKVRKNEFIIFSSNAIEFELTK